MSDFDFRGVGLGYECDWIRDGLRFSFSRITRKSSGLHAEVWARAFLPGVPKVLYRGNANISSGRDRASIANHMADRSGMKKGKEGPIPDWLGYVDMSCEAVMAAEDKGLQVSMVGRKAVDRTNQWLFHGFVPMDKPTIFYGEAGATKGFLVLALLLSVATGVEIIPGFRPTQVGSVAYFDWEDVGDELNERIQMICRGVGIDSPEMPHVFCYGAMSDRVEELAALVAEHRVVAYAVDSMEMALGRSEGGTPNDPTKTLYTAIRMIGGTALIVDHPNKMGQQYGDSYKRNLARAVYEVKRDRKGSDGFAHIGIFDSKRNKGRDMKPVALRAEFTDEAVVYRREDLSSELAQNLTMRERAISVLLHGPLSATDLAAELGLEKDSDRDKLRVTLNRGKGKDFTQTPEMRWAVLSREPGQPARPPLRMVAGGGEEFGELPI